MTSNISALHVKEIVHMQQKIICNIATSDHLLIYFTRISSNIHLFIQATDLLA